MELSCGINKWLDEIIRTRDESKEKEIEDKENELEGTEDVRSLYNRQFHPVEYMKQYYSEIDPEEGFFLTQLHHFFQDKQKSTHKLGLSPQIVLEVGSGPLISGPNEFSTACCSEILLCLNNPPGLASASASADLLIFSDLLSTNLSFLIGCLENPQPALPSLAFVANLEGCTVEKVGFSFACLSDPSGTDLTLAFSDSNFVFFLPTLSDILVCHIAEEVRGR